MSKGTAVKTSRVAIRKQFNVILLLDALHKKNWFSNYFVRFTTTHFPECWYSCAPVNKQQPVKH